MNIFSKTNRAIADIASKVMSENPAKVKEVPQVKPLDKSFVDQVAAAGLKGRFDIRGKTIKEERDGDSRTYHNARQEDAVNHEGKEVQKAKLPHKTGMPKPLPPLDNKTIGKGWKSKQETTKGKHPEEHHKTTDSSAEDGTLSRGSVTLAKEGIDAGLTNNGQITMRGVYTAGSKKSVSERIKKAIAKRKGK